MSVASTTSETTAGAPSEQLGSIPADQRFDRLAERPEATKLHLGCGRTILEGWINLDREALPGVDVVADLDACRAHPLPIADDSVDIIFASHLLEHISDPLAFMEELWRIAKPGAMARLKTPYGSSDSAFEDPTHVRQYFVQSHLFFAQPCYWRADYGYRGDWQPRTVQLAMEEARWKGKSTAEVFEAVMERRNVVREMSADLEAIKPRRAADRELLEKPEVNIQLF